MNKSLIKNFLWSFLQQGSGQIINFIITIFLTRLLTPEDFGLMAITYVFYILGERFSDLGLGQSVIRSLEVDENDYNSVFFVNIVISVAYYLLLYIFAPYVAEFYEKEELILLIRVSGLSIILMALCSAENVKLTRNLEFKTIAFISILSSSIGGILGIIAAYLGFGIWSLVILYLTSIIVKNLIMWYNMDLYPKLAFDKAKFIKHYQFGYKISLTFIIDAIYSNFIVLIIGRFYSLTDTGFYSRADSTKNIIVNSFFGPIQKILMPYFSKLQNEENLTEHLLKILNLLFYIFCPLLIITITLAEPLIVVIFSDKWISVVPFFKILLIAALLYPAISINIELMKIKGRADLALKAEIFIKIIGIVVILIAFNYSLLFLIKTQIFLAVVNFLVFSYYNQKELSYSLIKQIKVMLPTFFISLALWFLLDFTLNFLNFYNNFFKLIYGYGFGILCFIGVSYILRLEVLIFILTKFKTFTNKNKFNK